MRALTVRQPWPWAIFFAGKDFENRSWFTGYRGELAIHAAKGCTRAEYLEAREFIEDVGGVIVPELENLPRGAVVGVVELYSCVTSADSEWFVGKYGFGLRRRRVLAEPVPCPGARGLWALPRGVERAVRAARDSGYTAIGRARADRERERHIRFGRLNDP